MRAAMSSPAARLGSGRAPPLASARCAVAAGFALPLPFVLASLGRSAPPNRRVFAINRYAHKTGVLYNCRAPSPSARGKGACNYKPPAVQNGRFVQSPRLKRSEGGGAEFVLPPAKAGLRPPKGARPRLWRERCAASPPNAQRSCRRPKEQARRSYSVFHSFFNTPPPLDLRGGRSTRLKAKKELPRKRRSSFFRVPHRRKPTHGMGSPWKKAGVA